MNCLRFIFSAIFPFLLFLLAPEATADLFSDKQALLDFLNITHGRDLNWNPASSVCTNWVGVTCSYDYSRIVSVRLPGVGLFGQIPPNTLSRLSALQVLSLRSNSLTGPFPNDFAKLKELRLLYLQYNDFSGPLPSDFSVWQNLTVIDLSFNNFNGTIPTSLSNLTQLSSLNLEHNSLSGPVPDLNLSNLQLLDLAHNHLNGTIPSSLERFSSSSFAGNNLTYQNQTFPNESPSVSSPLPSLKRSKKLGSSSILGIAVGGCALFFLAFALLLLICSKRKLGNGLAEKSYKGDKGLEKAGSQDEYRAGDNNKLVFFEGCTFVFDLEDLLRASAEILGKGTFGTAYKAVLEDATMVVVKRLKEVIVGKRDFEQQMEMVGRIKHDNVVPLRAFYYSKDEKLVVYDYFTQGSVSQLLHGKRGSGERTPLNWDTRLKISLGAARGIARIHEENAGKLIHGNIKASNIFLNSKQEGCVSDLGWTALINPAMPPSRIAGYRAPEVIETRKASQRSDVYSFGVLLLELLTGKSPVQATAGEEIVNLARWVQSVVREEWTAEVFDIELIRHQNIDEEMVEMLQIAMACVVRIPEQRPKMSEVVTMIEDVRRFDSGNRPSSEAKSDDSSSRAPATYLASTSNKPDHPAL